MALAAVVVIVACGSGQAGQEKEATPVSRATAPETTEAPTTSAAEPTSDPLLTAYVSKATRTRRELERGLAQVKAYVVRLAEGASVKKGDVRVFARLGHCRERVSRLRPPAEMQDVQALLEEACRLGQRGSLELVHALGRNSARLAGRAGKHMATATLALDRAGKKLEEVRG
jgi:hypothetical protein